MKSFFKVLFVTGMAIQFLAFASRACADDKTGEIKTKGCAEVSSQKDNGKKAQPGASSDRKSEGQGGTASAAK